MHTALSEHPVRGTTACICSMNKLHLTLAVKRMDGFSRYHNFKFDLTLSFPGSPAGLPGPHTKSSRRSSCYNREVGVWVRLKAISVVLSLILASLGRFPRNFLPFSDSYTFLVYHQDI